MPDNLGNAFHQAMRDINYGDAERVGDGLANLGLIFGPAAIGKYGELSAGLRGGGAVYYLDDAAGAGASAGEVTTFYHGTSAEYAAAIRARGIDLTAGESFADFGKGFYLTTSREEALMSASRRYSGSLDVVEFNVPTQQFNNLSKLEFGSANGAWQDFVGFHKTYSPEILVHAGQPYDLVTGPLFRRYSGGAPISWETRLPQTSIHTPNAVDLFNSHMKGN
jgi:hypothetical protein